MNTVRSSDGTTIAYETIGHGPPLLLVDGALCRRAFGPSRKLAAAVASDFAVTIYDRRGRDDSGDTLPYAVEREVEDIEALVQATGGSTFMAGSSSGAALALEAANSMLGIQKLALYEPPFFVDRSGDYVPEDFQARLEQAVAADRRGDAVKMFMKQVGTPAAAIVAMRLLPVWRKLTAVAHTLPYDIAILGESSQGKPLPTTRWTAVTMPTLVMDGGKSPDSMRKGVRSLANVLPNSDYRTLPGQTHMVKPKALAPVLAEFLNDDRTTTPAAGSETGSPAERR